VLNERSIRRRQFPQNSTYSGEQSAIINAIYSSAKCYQKRVIITDSLSTMMVVSDRKRFKDPKTQTIRKLIDKESIRNSRRCSERSIE
jgi:archaellum biogenesis ATPase FlaH